MQKLRLRKILLELVMILFTVIYMFPVMNLVFSSLKSTGDLMRNPVGLPSVLEFGNYVVAWTKMDYPRAFFNTVVICGGSILFIVIIGSMAAYPIARYRTHFNQAMYLFFLATIMIPGQAIMIPLVRLFYKTRLVNTHISLIVYYTAAAVPFAVFLFTGFIKTIPAELEEAAAIDGSGALRTFWKVIFPLMKSSVTTVIILNIMWIWNDFMMPMVLLQSEKMRTLTPSIFNFFEEFVTQWNYAFAASVLVMVPGILAFLLLQKHFIEGMVAGGVKS